MGTLRRKRSNSTRLLRLAVTCGQSRYVGTVGRTRIAIDIVADQQKCLWFCHNDIPEFHVAVFIDARPEGEARVMTLFEESAGLTGALGSFVVRVA